MASEFVDLVSQTNGILPIGKGGTGNQQGFAGGTYVVASNRTGSSIPCWSTVIFDGNANLVVTTLDNQVPVAGVAIGLLQTDGTILTGVAVPNGALVVVQTSGQVQVFVDSSAGGLHGYGDYIYTTSAEPGHTLGLPTRSAGAIGVLLTSVSSGFGWINLWSGAAIGGPQVVTQEGVSVNPQTDGMDFASVLPARAYTGETAVDIAPELLGGLVANQIAYAYGSTGITTVRPASDVVTQPTVTYSTGSTAWAILNATSVGAQYVGLGAPVGGVVCGFTNPGLDYTHRVDSVTLFVYRSETLAGPNARLIWRDPGTGQLTAFGSYVPATGYISFVFMTRPWDSRPWTLSDLPFLEMGIQQAGSVYQMYITIGWTKIVSVGDELTALAGGGDIWRPLLASDGTIITAGPGGEAVMGFGPA